MSANVGLLEGLKLRGGHLEKKIGKIFSKFFFITFSRKENFKYSEYSFNFLKPTDDFRRSFNLSNEILMLFSDYKNFDTRTMDFVDKTLYQFENRLDKICIILISKDNQIDKKISQINKQDKDSRIVVPFSYEEVTSKNFDFNSVKTKFRKYFYSRDLFALESPLRSEAYFYGRSSFVHSLYDSYSLGEHSGLFGLRKIGKTSVLFALQRTIKVRGGKSLFIDCQDTAVHKARWNELLYDIIQNIKEKYKLDISTLNESKYQGRKVSVSFKKDLKKCYKELNGERILLIFDEIEHISFDTASTEHWKSGEDFLSFWQTIRAANQKEPELFSFIVAGVNPYCLEKSMVEGYDNPIFSLAKVNYLDLFEYEDVKEMVSNIGGYMGLTFEEEIYSKLNIDYGGHPFLIRHICSLIDSDIKYDRPYKVTKYDYSEQKKKYDRKILNYIDLIVDVLKEWYPREYELLEILAIEGNDEFKKRIKTMFGYQSQNIIDHLIGYGIIKENNDKYYIQIDSIENYFKSLPAKSNHLKSKKEKQSEISKRRNELEDKLRKIIYIVLYINCGDAEKVRDKIVNALQEKRRKQVSGIKLKNILNNKLYFNELKDIINKYWSDFEDLFNNKRKFNEFASLINKHRIDAHAKDISEDDLGLLMIAIRWFEDTIEEIMSMEIGDNEFL